MPRTPSSSTPDISTPTAREPKATATDRNNVLIAGRNPFSVGPFVRVTCSRLAIKCRPGGAT